VAAYTPESNTAIAPTGGNRQSGAVDVSRLGGVATHNQTSDISAGVIVPVRGRDDHITSGQQSAVQEVAVYGQHNHEPGSSGSQE